MTYDMSFDLPAHSRESSENLAHEMKEMFENDNLLEKPWIGSKENNERMNAMLAPQFRIDDPFERLEGFMYGIPDGSILWCLDKAVKIAIEVDVSPLPEDSNWVIGAKRGLFDFMSPEIREATIPTHQYQTRCVFKFENRDDALLFKLTL